MMFKTIGYKTPEYSEMVALRNEVLRKPLGLIFSEDELEREAPDIFCICEEDNRIIGCCILTSLRPGLFRLRQMAIYPSHQRKHVGRDLLQFAEETAKKEGFKKITMHARMSAKDFYAKHGYEPIGGIFTEVGIPHVRMEKELQ